jgi:hypothetical protein
MTVDHNPFPLHQIFMFQQHPPPPFIHIKSMNLRAQKFAELAYGCLSHLRERSHPNQVLFIIVRHGTGIQLEKVVSCAHYHLW